MDSQIPVNIPIFDGDGDPKNIWFVCESLWKANLIDDENQQINQFAGGLRNKVLTWYINFLEEDPKSKQQKKDNSLEFFKVNDTKHMAGHKLKQIKKRIGESIREYDSRFKYIMIRMPSKLDPSLVIKVFINGLQQRIKTLILMNEYTSY